jgi:two-component system LytT family response regulator
MSTSLSQLLPSYSCVIIDDDATALEVLKNYINRLPELQLFGSYQDASVALDEMSDKRIDFLFLDIRMPVSGIDFARKIRDKVDYIIFITAYTDYALDAFSVHADHYMIKPLYFDDFLTAVNRVLSKDGHYQIAAR